ncbi:MAG TPA: UbiA family prenyltransferase [Bacteroidia bacterium]|jgi:4-hydroxybenzoate polyprenyltransferase|nr:UbiA family prenyltransferase [Bacteroidia bacterium]
MKTIASAIHFFVFSNLFISTCVLCFTVKTSLIIFGNSGNVHVNLLAFSATLFLYGFHKVYRRFRFSEAEHKEERHNWVDEHKKTYYTVIALAFIGAITQLFYMPLRVFVLMVPVGFMAAGYSIPFIKTKRGFIRLRDISWLKALWIGLSYAWLTTFLPIAFEYPVNRLLQPVVIFMFIRNFLFVFALVIPFDIRDLHYDAKNGMRTLPVIVGIKGAIRLSVGLMFAFIIATVIQWVYFGFDTWISAALCLSALEAALVIPFAKPERPNLFFPLAVESSMMLQWALVFAAVHLA